MEFIFLGTSAGKPTKERNVSSIAMRLDQSSEWFLFDCGEATQNRLLYTPVSLGKIKKIFITHLHGDHFFGLPGVLSSRHMDNVISPIEIYAPKGIKKFLQTIEEISQMNLDFEIKITEFKEEDKFSFDSFDVEIISLKHSIESYAFLITQKPPLPKLNEQKLKEDNIPPSPIYAKLKRGEDVKLSDGRVIKSKDYILESQKPLKVIISGDNEDPYIFTDYKDIDLLIHEATYTKEVFESLTKKQKHTTAEDLAKAASKANIKNLIATHISARYSLIKKEKGHFIGEIEEEIRKYFKSTFFVAKDLDRFQLTNDGKLIFKENLQSHICL